MSQIENLFEVAKDERKQLLEKNQKLSDRLNITQDKYSSILKKPAIIQMKVLEAQENLTQELDH